MKFKNIEMLLATVLVYPVAKGVNAQHVNIADIYGKLEHQQERIAQLEDLLLKLSNPSDDLPPQHSVLRRRSRGLYPVKGESQRTSESSSENIRPFEESLPMLLSPGDTRTTTTSSDGKSHHTSDGKSEKSHSFEEKNDKQHLPMCFNVREDPSTGRPTVYVDPQCDIDFSGSNFIYDNDFDEVFDYQLLPTDDRRLAAEGEIQLKDGFCLIDSCIPVVDNNTALIGNITDQVIFIAQRANECGYEGLDCCFRQFCHTPLLTCDRSLGVYGTCVKCGAHGDICCNPPDDFCTNGARCQAGTCVFTGWCQVGKDVDGEQYRSGTPVLISLSADGNRLAVGNMRYDSYEIPEISQDDIGIIRVYDWDGVTWNQTGTILGKTSGSRSGSSVSLSGDGMVLAIRSSPDPYGLAESDYVQAFRWNSNDLMWHEIGEEIPGDDFDCTDHCHDWVGKQRSIALSYDGNVAVVGARSSIEGTNNVTGVVRVYRYDDPNDTWDQVGQNITGEELVDMDLEPWYVNEIVRSVAISNDGRSIAIGAPFYSPTGNYHSHYSSSDGTHSYSVGHVRVLDFNEINDTWDQIGGEIKGLRSGDKFGASVALSVDGSIVAAGAYGHDFDLDDNNDIGRVTVYKRNAVNTTEPSGWEQIGQDIIGERVYDDSGYSIDISADGTVVAIGAPSNDGFQGYHSHIGHVRVWKYDDDLLNDDDGEWVQINSDIDGEEEGDMSGGTVALSEDGSRVAIGASRADGDDYLYDYNPGTSKSSKGDRFYDVGHVRVYHVAPPNSNDCTDVYY